MPTYATAADLRAELEVNEATLSDTAANKLLGKAERRIDRLLGAVRIYEATGRKIDPTELEAWRATKVKDATVAIAAATYRDSTVFDTPQAKSIEGPSFKLTDLTPVKPAAAAVLVEACALLDEAGLRRLTARVTF